MALIENAKGRRKNQSPSGYTRLFGIPELGQLMSRVQGTVISAGTELEKLIYERATKIPDLDEFLVKTLHTQEAGIWVASKKQVKKSKSIHSKYEPDFIAFDLIKKICYVIEVKDGDTFDTKKSGGEHGTIHNFTNDVSFALPFSFQIFICCFNANSKEEIFTGLKGKFAMTEILTGKELCILFKIDYNEIVKIRTNDQQGNLDYFIKELIAIPSIRTMISKRISGFKK
jgi:hypothetical protein